jgi:hypothetical protein
VEHKLILGGEKFLPFARSRIKALRAAGLKYASQSFEMDGVSVNVNVSGEHEYIQIDGGRGYMESGVLDLLDIQFGARDTYLPAVIRTTPHVESLMAGEPSTPNAGDRKIKDGDESWSAAGCMKKSGTVDMVIESGTAVHFDSDPAAFCEPEQMKTTKRLMERIPSSTYTGKLKLFIQALYGSQRKDYRAGGLAQTYLEVSTGKFTVPPEGSLDPPREIFASVTNGYTTHGLVTIPKEKDPSPTSNKYLLVDVGLSGVSYRAMKKKGGVNTVKGSLPADLESAVEAFTLASLVPDVEVVDAQGPSLTPFLSGWENLFYGWHFNEAGDKAAIVMKRAKTISGVTFHNATPTTIVGYEFVQYVITFNWDYKEARLGFTIEETTRGDHIPYVQTNVFFPDVFANNLALLVPPQGPPWDCWATLTAPLYCYYDKDDALVTVMINNTAPVDRPAEKTPNEMLEITGSSIIVEGTWELVDLPPSKFVPSSGVAFGGASYKGEYVSYYGPTFRQIMHIVITPDSNGGQIIVDGGSYLRTVRKDNESTRATAFCVIPFGDASAVIAGLETATTGAFAYSIYQIFSNYVRVMYPYANPPYSRPSLWNEDGLLLWSTDREDPGGGVRPSPGTILSSAACHTSAGVDTLSTFSATWHMDESMPTAPFAGLFHPAGGAEPYYGRPMTVRTSYFGALQHLYCEPVLDPAKVFVSKLGWPEARWSAAVGYA